MITERHFSMFRCSMRRILLPCAVMVSSMYDCAAQYPSPEKVAADFRHMLSRPSSALRPAVQVTSTDSLIVERGYFYSEETEKVPVLMYKPVNLSGKRLPVVICLHGTGGNKDERDIRDLLSRFSKAGFMGVAIDARFHGERVPGGAHGSAEYVDAIINAWSNKDSGRQQHPFYWDTVYDLWRLTDYLVSRDDVDRSRIGMMGISMGGIETWMAASTDKRIKVAVPIISAQSFRWSLENNAWQGRARTIWPVHQQVARDLGDTGVNQSNVRIFWNKLLPGITGEFDCPSMIRLFVPRPLLLLNNEKDPNNPLGGAQLAFDAARKAYLAKKAGNHLKTDISPNELHRLTPRHVALTVEWFKKWL